MSWLSSGVHWISTIDAIRLSAWSGALSAASGIAVAIATMWLGKLTRVLATETQLAREATSRADVQCSIEPHVKSIALRELVVANIGRASAKNVVVSVKRGGHFSTSSPSLPAFPFSNMLPGGRVRIFIGSYMQMSEKVFAAEISYEDNFGRHTFSYEEDLSLQESMVQVGSNLSVEVADALTKISDQLRKWDRSGRLTVSAYNRADREQERKDWEAGMQTIEKENLPKK